MTVSYNYSIIISIIHANLLGYRIGFKNTSYIVNEGIRLLEVCVRMFEPAEESSLGSITISIGVETVRGTAGIVCSDAVTTLHVYCILFDSQMEVTIRK